MDQSKTPKEKTGGNIVKRRTGKERQAQVPAEDLEQIRRELGWGLVKHHHKHEIKKKK